MSSPASLPKEITRSVERGELQKVVKWLRKGGLVDALGSTTARDGRPTTDTLLLAATVHGHLAMVRELLIAGPPPHSPSPAPPPPSLPPSPPPASPSPHNHRLSA